MGKLMRFGLAALSIAAAFLAQEARAAVCTSVATGNWSAAATWSCVGAPPATVPGINDSAIIASPHTVTLTTANISVANLTVNAGGTLAGNNRNLTVPGPVIISGTYNTAGGNLTTTGALGALTVNTGGTFNFNNGNAAISGNLTVNGTLASGGDALQMTGTNTTFSGTGNISDTDIEIDASGISIPAGSNLAFDANAQIRVASNVSPASLTVNGTVNGTAQAVGDRIIRVSTGGTLTVGATGIVNAPNSRLDVRTGASATNNGTITIGELRGRTGTPAPVFTQGVNSTLNARFAVCATTDPCTFNASAAGNTVNYNGAAQAVKGASTGRYYHLTLSGSGVKTMPPPVISSLLVGGNFTMAGTASATATDIIKVSGNFTIGAGTAFNNGTSGHNIGGNFTNSGTYTSSTGSINFNGTALQTLTGTTTFYRIQVSNNAGLSLANSMTVSNMLIFSNGNITTNANTLITTANCATSVSRSPISSGHVVGNLRKRIPAGASTCTFQVGSGTSYTPLVAVFVAGTTAGNITASTVGADHPSIASSGINPARSVNRYWTLTNGPAPLVGLPVAGFSATFNFINGSPVDFDAGSIPANFIVQRWNGATWGATTLNATCTATPATNLCKQINGLTAATFGDFAIGEPAAAVVTPGSFNAFETGTAAGAITGRINTKLAGVAFGLDVVAISGGAQMNTFTNSAIVELLGNQATGVPLDAQNCPTSSTLIQTVTPNPTITGGRSTVSFAAVANAWKDVRVRVRFPVATPTVISCSTDNFAIRPSAFTVTSTNATNSGTSGAPAIKTGANFNLTAASIAGYNGTPAIDNTVGMVTGTPVQGAIGGVFSAAPAATGTAAGNAFFYNEVGNFGLNTNAVFDDTFTSVDQPGDCTADFSNALVGGRYGCKFGSTAVPLVIGGSGFGRFIPDNFNVAYNTPALGAACGTFGYVGQVFTYTTVPEITVAARQGTANGLTDATTLNYAGAYMKLTNASLAQAPYDTTAGRYSRFDALGGGATPLLDTGGLPPAATDPVIGTFTNGVGALTFGAGTGLRFARSLTTPSAPFNADIALALNVVDTDGVAFAGTASFGAAGAGNGIAFGGGNGMRFGRLMLANAHGSELLNLPVPVLAQFWNGTAFVTNTLDNCTALAANNIALTTPPAGVGVSAGITLLNGAGTLILTRPTTPAKVSVDLCADLGVDPVGGTVCSATSAAMSYLQGIWPLGTSSYNNDPTARATFGVYKGSNEFIYLRENY